MKNEVIKTDDFYPSIKRASRFKRQYSSVYNRKRLMYQKVSIEKVQNEG